MQIETKPIEIFCSYSPFDQALFDHFVPHLQLLKRRGQITDWNTSKTFTGKEPSADLDPRLNTAPILLIFLSPDYIASDYLWEELTRAAERHQTRKAKVIVINLRTTNGWREIPLGKLYALPDNEASVLSSRNLDDTISECIRKIQIVIKDLS